MFQKTSKKIIISLILFISVTGIIHSQEKRIFNFNSEEVPYYLSLNFKYGLSILPNLNAKIVIVNDQESLLSVSESIKIPEKKIYEKDYLLYYYLKLPKLKSEKEYLNFLKAFIEENYNRDVFNRNTISIDFKQNTIPFSCESLEELNTFLAQVIVSEKSNLLKCGRSFILSNNNLKEKLKTSISYESIRFIGEAEKIKEDYKLLKSLSQWKNTYFIAIKLGLQEISKNQRTTFDEETRVDFSDLKTVWNIDAGYMFSEKFGGFLNFGITYKKEQKDQNISNSVNGITISGSGSGAGVIKIGLGVKYIPFVKDRWSIYTDLAGGFLSAKAGGGDGSVTISNGNVNNTISKVERTEKSKYLNLSLGANYRLGRTVFLTSNFQYSISNFENNIGSVSGFTGYTINLGVGFSFK
ncbi:conserved protein of unknown function [Tenacibaculum insulae]|jgi:hypothetical protein